MVYKLKNKGGNLCEYRGFDVVKLPQEKFRDYQAQRYWYDVPALKIVAYSMPDLKAKIDKRMEGK